MHHPHSFQWKSWWGSQTTKSSTSSHYCFPSSFPHSTKCYTTVDPTFYPWLLSSWESIHNLSIYGQLSLKLSFMFNLNGKIKKKYLTRYLHRPRTTRSNSINFPNAKERTITELLSLYLKETTLLDHLKIIFNIQKGSWYHTCN